MLNIQDLVQIKIEQNRLDAGIGVLSDGVVNTRKMIDNIDSLVAKQKENAFDFQNSELSLSSVDFISTLDFNGRLIRLMRDYTNTPNINTYDNKVREKVDKYVEVIRDNYYLLGKMDIPKGDLKEEIILERVAEQKSQLEQFSGRLGIVNPELSESIKETFPPKVFNDVVDVAKHTSIAEADYKPAFKMNR